MCRRLLDRNRLQPGDIDLMVSHQANRRIILSAAERLGFPAEKVVINIDRITATRPRPRSRWPSTTPSQDGRLKKGSLVLVTSVGAGFTVGRAAGPLGDLKGRRFRLSGPRSEARHDPEHTGAILSVCVISGHRVTKLITALKLLTYMSYVGSTLC